MTADVSPFTIEVSDDVLADLRRRLERTRWPDAETVDDWSQGIPLQYVQTVCDYWADDYDWRARELALNRFDQFTTEIGGIDLHFVHARSPHPGALPLLISHGWPGSIVEFHKVIEPLTDPTRHGGRAADAFHVVAPSLPGFGFSGKPTTTGWGVDRIADAFAALMDRLGHRRFVAQGGDWGSAITSSIGARHAGSCAAIHLTMAMGVRPPADGELSAQGRRAVERATHHRRWGTGYAKQQSTRPQTLAYGLVDSPSAQAAWILEKFWAWTDCDGHPENVLTRDELLDNIMLYWINGNGASSARLYWESFVHLEHPEVSIPSGFAVFPKEILPPVREWVETRYTDVHHWTEHDKGGHFAALEVPAAFVEDVRACFRPFR